MREGLFMYAKGDRHVDKDDEIVMIANNRDVPNCPRSKKMQQMRTGVVLRRNLCSVAERKSAEK